jgi:dipeptidyl aminopeptidase/acylaminoacyl peptidase
MRRVTTERLPGPLLAVALTLAPICGSSQSVSRGRPMVPNDILSIREYGDTPVSPDGQFVAVEVVRSRSEDSSQVRIDGVTRSDLWVVRRDGSSRRRVLPDRSSIVNTWHPVWSPTGRYLAFLSSSHHANAFVNVWDRRTGASRLMATGPVDLQAGISIGSADYSHPLCWLDSTHLAVVTLPRGIQALAFHEDLQTLETEYKSSAVVNEGRVPTVVVASSPMDSGPRPTEPRASLLILDARNASVRRIGDMPATQIRGAKRIVIVSRNRRWAALVVHLDVGRPDSITGWELPASYPAQMGIASLVAQNTGVRWISGVSPFTGIGNTYSLPFTWTLNDSALIFLSFAAEQSPDDESHLEISAVNPQTLRRLPMAPWITRRVTDDPREPIALRWASDGRLVMRTRWRGLWSLHGDSLVPATDDGRSAGTSSRAANDLRLDASADGRLSATDSSGRERTIFPAINPQLDAIEGPHYIPVQYSNARGDTLHATALLPYNYVAGRRYPTVVWVYGGDVSGSKDAPVDRFAERDDDAFVSLLPLSGHGYVVLKPSIPLGPFGIASDPMLQMNDGVEPAVDSLIAMGLADSAHVALMGHSYGGYTVYGILTQTHRYKTAIALMGISDLISDYGKFDVGFKYAEPDVAATETMDTEKGQLRMGSPLWQDPQRYMRNSPLFFADRIDTPVLIVDGSRDFLSTQSEEMFSALFRLGRRAEILTYVGENHGLESPANIEDLWTRMFRWLDRYLMPSGS